MSLVRAFHNIFVDKYCLMYTEETALKKQQVFKKDVSSERMEQLQEENTVK